MVPTLGLCMMVKNEADVIERALASVRPFLDAWSILDTGSTDDTMLLADAAMLGIPGAVTPHLWQDFADGRSAAMRVAQSFGTDYLLVMDADQTLVVDDPDFKASLAGCGYNLEIHHGNLVYPHPWLLQGGREWRWEGATHEYLVSGPETPFLPLHGVHLVEHADSSRRKGGAKLTEDMALLEAAYADDPSNTRTVFYLAQACADLGKFACALKHYKERVALGGWHEEAWCAQYRVARLHERQNNWEWAADAYLRAYNMLPQRAEPFYYLGRGYLARSQFALAKMFLEEATVAPEPKLGLFVEREIYTYKARWGLAIALRMLRMHDDAEILEGCLLDADATPYAVKGTILGSRQAQVIHALPD